MPSKDVVKRSASMLIQKLQKKYDEALNPGANFSLKGFIVQVATYADVVLESGKAPLIEKKLLKVERELAKEHEELAAKVEKELAIVEKFARSVAKGSHSAQVEEMLKELDLIKSGSVTSNMTSQQLLCNALVELLESVGKYVDLKTVKEYVLSVDPLKVDYSRLCPSFDEYQEALEDFRLQMQTKPIEGWRLIKQIHTSVLHAREAFKKVKASGDFMAKLNAVTYLGPFQKILKDGFDETIVPQEVKEHFVRAHIAILETLESDNKVSQDYSDIAVFDIAFKSEGIIVINRNKEFTERLSGRSGETKMVKLFDLLWKSRSEIMNGKERNGEVRTRNLKSIAGLDTPNAVRMQIRRINNWVKERGLPISIQERGDGYQMQVILQKQRS
jgi:hypothetical protein